MFFAFSKADEQEELDNPYRAIYILNKTPISDENYFRDIRVLEPRKDDHGRLVNQAGLFTFSPYDATIDNKLIEVLGGEDYPDDELRNASQKEGEEASIIAKYICKIYIKNEQQQECLKFLRRMNVHHASLFPDLIGAADYSNILIEEWELNRQDRSSTALTPQPQVISPTGVSTDLTIPSPNIDHAGVNSLYLLLRKSLNNTVEIEPAILTKMVIEVSRVVSEYQGVDFEARKDLISALQAKVRIILRKLSYPEAARDIVISRILDFVPK